MACSLLAVPLSACVNGMLERHPAGTVVLGCQKECRHLLAVDVTVAAGILLNSTFAVQSLLVESLLVVDVLYQWVMHWCFGDASLQVVRTSQAPGFIRQRTAGRLGWVA